MIHPGNRAGALRITKSPKVAGITINHPGAGALITPKCPKVAGTMEVVQLKILLN
jgi:hypothetical protein